MKDYRSNYDVERLKRILAAGGSTSRSQDHDEATSLAEGGQDGPRWPTVPPQDRSPSVRRRTLGGLMVAAVVVVAVGPHFLRTSPTTNAATDPANGFNSPGVSQAASANPLINPCPQEPVRLDDQPLPTGELATGAVSVRLCRAMLNGHPSPWAAPVDALVTDVDGFVYQVDALPDAGGRSCPPARARGGEPFTLTVSYPGGRTVQLFGTDSACSGVQTGGHVVSPDRLLDVFHHRLTEQRAGTR